MQILYSWMKQVVFFIILLALIYQLIPNEKYKSFVRLMGGFLFLLFILSPVMQLFQLESTLDTYIRSFQFQQENREFVWQLENAGIKAYEPVIEEVIMSIAKEKKVTLTFCEPVWNSGMLTGIRMGVTYKRVGLTGETAESTPVVDKLKEEIAAVYALPQKDIVIMLEK